MTWDPDTLKQFVDSMLSQLSSSAERDRATDEARFATFQLQIDTLRTSWHDRFIEFEKAFESRLHEQAREIGPLRKLIYIGVGIAISASVGLPLLLHR